jgi:hypothetical protein
MNMISSDNFVLLLRAAAIAQFTVAILNLFLIRIMKWKPDLNRVPLLIREVFRIHVVFIPSLGDLRRADLAIRS